MMNTSEKIISAIQTAVGCAGKTGKLLALHEPDIGEEERQAVLACLESGWTSSAGPLVDEFEAKLARYCGVSHAVACVNGTAALHIALYAAGVRPGDEVIVPAISFVATANAVIYNQAIPHFVDICETDLAIDPTELGRYLDVIGEIRDGHLYNRHTDRRISAILPLHCLGYPCQIEALVALGEHLGVPVIEDAAEALGSFQGGRALGAFGKASVLSFNGNKIITSGGGGAILTDDAELARHARHLTTTAKVAHAWEYSHDELGYNYRMPSLNAALGIGQLGRIETFLKNKTALHERYLEAFSSLDGVRVLVGCEGSRPNHWLNAIILPEALASKRDEILSLAREENMMLRPLWALLPDQPHLQGGPVLEYPVARSLDSRVICLPSSSFIAQEIL